MDVSGVGQLDFYRLFCKNDDREVVMEEIERCSEDCSQECKKRGILIK